VKAVLKGCGRSKAELNTALIAVVRSDAKRAPEEDLAIVEELIQAGADVNAEVEGYGGPYYALREAVFSKKALCAKRLIAAGAQLKPPGGKDASDLLYELLFYWDRPDFEVAEFLVAHGADVNLHYPGGGTYLHFARLHSRQDVIDFLVRHGAKDQP
jgi:ankyrin repeat protein